MIQCVLVTDSAIHSKSEGVENNGGSLKDGAEAFMPFLRRA